MGPTGSQTVSQIEPPKSISDQIYEILKHQILTGRLASEERLFGKEVAAQLKASRTPVREAFRCLEHDGLVERLPQGGVKVKTITMEEIHDFFDIRIVLEAHAIKRACEHASAEDIEALTTVKSEAEALLAQTVPDREEKIELLLELNTRFHEIIYRAAGNRHLTRIINDLRSIVMRMRALGLRGDGTWVQAWEEHGRLIDLIRMGDKDAATALLREHLLKAASYVIASAGRLSERRVGSGNR